MGNKLLSKMCPTHPTHPTHPTRSILRPTRPTYPDTFNLFENKEMAGVSDVSSTSAKVASNKFSCRVCRGGVKTCRPRGADRQSSAAFFSAKLRKLFLF
jgi:hypothetical protein